MSDYKETYEKFIEAQKICIKLGRKLLRYPRKKEDLSSHF